MIPVAPALTIAQLNARMEEASQKLGVPIARVRRMLCTLIISQMLPDAVAVKGGMGIKLRLGESGTRATADLDVSTKERGEVFESAFRERLAKGWGTVPASKGALRKNPAAPDRVAFTATVKKQRRHDPGLTHPQYVIHPYRVTLAFLGSTWAGLDVEVSDPEIEPHAHSRLVLDGELIELGAYFGFGDLVPVELVDLEFQIAQKIHAVTDPAYNRAHDLVDLQLLCSADPDLSEVHKFSVRTFDFRCSQKWPPIPLRAMDGWDIPYSEARKETQVRGESLVLPSIDAARKWLTKLIMDIDDSTPSRSNNQ